jgi:hypothetical protein
VFARAQIPNRAQTDLSPSDAESKIKLIENLTNTGGIFVRLRAAFKGGLAELHCLEKPGEECGLFPSKIEFSSS